MNPLPPLAFIDVETTGLDAAVDRIAEVGVVLVDGAASTEWSRLLAVGAARLRDEHCAREPEPDRAPVFGEIAAELKERLAGRLLIAHNARFDYAFLKAEYERSGDVFEADVLCSLALSRALYPHESHHDLDSLLSRHALTADVRHRALPDARLLAQFWRVVERDHAPATIAKAIADLRAEPALPPQLDPTLLARLPDGPGLYVFHGDDGAVLHAAVAQNLRLHVTNYFRIDRVSPKALTVATRVREITWRATSGVIGARLQLAAFERATLPSHRVAARCDLFSWKFVPDASSLDVNACVELVVTSAPHAADDELFGFFTSERKARNALARLTARILDTDACEDKSHPQRLRRVMQIYAAMREWRLPRWPHEGPIGIRERRDLHVFDQWRHLGTARNASEVPEILATGKPEFDRSVFAYLTRLLPRIKEHRLVRLAPGRQRC